MPEQSCYLHLWTKDLTCTDYFTNPVLWSKKWTGVAWTRSFYRPPHFNCSDIILCYEPGWRLCYHKPTLTWTNRGPVFPRNVKMKSNALHAGLFSEPGNNTKLKFFEKLGPIHFMLARVICSVYIWLWTNCLIIIFLAANIYWLDKIKCLSSPELQL